MTLRQAWVRVRALPYDSPLAGALRDAAERAEQEQRSAALDDALTRYRPKGGPNA